MSAITLEAIKAKQSEVDELIRKFQTQTTLRQIVIEGRTIELQPGERYAGAKLDENGEHQHHIIVMAARPGNSMAWKAAQKWAVDQGGDVATPEEYALIKANCADLLTESWYWTNREHKDASYAWSFHSHGTTFNTHKSYEGSAVCVRRV